MLKTSFSSEKIEAGCDEAGRGCLAGPVVAAAVILPLDFSNELLNDSKKLTDKERYSLRPIIEENALSWAVAYVEPKKIDEINILNASFLAMTEAVRKLEKEPQLLLIDGNRFKTDLKIPFECIIKGDGKFMSIAAASILAKTYRDDLMKSLAKDHPEYGWDTNFGYPTIKHRKAIKDLGPNDHHRLSFQLLPRQLELFK